MLAGLNFHVLLLLLLVVNIIVMTIIITVTMVVITSLQSHLIEILRLLLNPASRRVVSSGLFYSQLQNYSHQDDYSHPHN